MRVTHAINNIYKLRSCLNFCCFLYKLVSDEDFVKVIHSNFYLRCIVSEITRFYIKPDMTSS